jgi:hypothetical protein
MLAFLQVIASGIFINRLKNIKKIYRIDKSFYFSNFESPIKLQQFNIKSTKGVMIMKDAMLGFVIDMAENDPFPEFDISLIVDGFIVSGYIISTKKYFEHCKLTKQIFDFASQVETEEPEESEPMEKYQYIHLKDAQYFSDSKHPIPSDGGIYTRIRLEKVSGFNFGKLERMIEK